MFAHGVGSNTLIWFNQVPVFSRSYRVVTYDQRGFGRSRCPRSHVEMRYLASDLLTLLDALELQRVAIVGHDMGGMGGLRLTLEHPERVSCLVICNSAGGILTPEILRAVAPLASEYQRQGPRDGMLLTDAFMRDNPQAAFLQRKLFELSPPFDPALLASAIEARIQPGELAGFATPTLIVTGGKDTLFPSDAVNAAARLIRGAKVVELPDSGHLPFYDAPDAFNRLVGEFLALHAAG